MQEDWELLLTFLPDDWRDLASKTGALKGLRKDKSPDGLLRVLLMHLACGHSLRETVVRARQAGLADLSDVALMKRLRKSRDWLRALCIALFEERGVDLSIANGFEIRAFDATVVKEPGKTGSLWYVHYSVRLPSLICDYFRITAASGAGTGESFAQFPVRHGDFVLGDRGYSTARGIAHVASAGGRVTVRVNTGSLVFSGLDGKPFDLLSAVSSLDRAGAPRAWRVETAGDSAPVQGRLCAVRKSDTAIGLAHAKLRRKASKSGKKLKPKTLEYAKYVILFTTFPESDFPPGAVLEWYRVRWQVELVFKRFKSITKLGHLPKHDDESAKAWLYGKLFTALLVEKLIRHASAVSPWGHDLPKKSHAEPVARLQIRLQSGHPDH